MSARGSIQTVLGPVSPNAVGPTLMHEHLLCDLTPPGLAVETAERVEVRLDNVFEIRHHWTRHYGHHILEDREVAASELARFRAAGGSAVVELTCEGSAPDPRGLADISRRTSLHRWAASSRKLPLNGLCSGKLAEVAAGSGPVGGGQVHGAGAGEGEVALILGDEAGTGPHERRIPEKRLANVMGKASTELFIAKDPFDARNRRISILLLRETVDEAVKRGEFGTVPNFKPRPAPAGVAPPPAPAYQKTQGAVQFP